jgi:hypothetical protein
VFSKAADVDTLLNMLKAIDPAHENLADNEEIQVRALVLVRWSSAETICRSCIGLAWLSGRRSSSSLTSTAKSGVCKLFIVPYFF